ncbi:dsDNA-binding protein PDCD5 [Metarhizium acridum CQMa 102]|uniref:DsDNA-binding protein PDCD5 n=1 Tax=Metarhizium acridum (strain CQMa 102) TaxID=655827 RepID=E9ECJ5_METAQ|nr:dsDNA-binding protein PDCD5 [Metarhizium acridum CQMa 102]EFY86372.1 dsDNA-binding protein PDCD5 [Metarhizium acridum CQMa 102]
MYPTNPLQRPWSISSQPEPSTAKPRPTPQFYVPSVLLPREAANSPTVHKIHILGDDERSKFIAHALSSVYDSVELLGWRSSPSSKYRNIQKVRPNNRRSAANVEANLAMPRAITQSDDSRIDQLVVSGRGQEAVEALQSVKNRIDGNTTVCLMNDGLGVLEDVRKKIFEGTDAAPNFLLGHMSHRLAFNRTYDAVTQLKQGQTKLTFAEAPRMRVKDMHKVESRPNFVKTLEEAKDLQTTLTSFDQWLRFKLPTVIFDSVVEPVCVLLEMPYQGLLQNPAAQRMMHSLLSEIIQVLENQKGSPRAAQGAVRRKQRWPTIQRWPGPRTPKTARLTHPTRPLDDQSQRTNPPGEFRQQDDARQHILNQILHPEAADRLGRIRLVKEQRATDIENRLITLAQTGQLRQKVTETQLKELLNAMADNKEEEKIVVSRRKGWDDDDDLLDL